MTVGLVKRVLQAELNGSNGHSIAASEFVELSLKDALLSADVLWKIRQLEILDGVSAQDSELFRTNIFELRKIVKIDKRLRLEDNDAFAALKQRRI